MQTTGQGHRLYFDDEALRSVKECFNTLDSDGGGSIGLEEIEQPLIGLGFAENREQV